MESGAGTRLGRPSRHVLRRVRVASGSTREVKLSGADVWTVREGKIARIEFFSHRSEALKAVGLEE